MNAIWKYALPFDRLGQSHLMPEKAQFRACGIQHGAIALWFEVNPKNVGEARTFKIVGTGHPEIDPAIMAYLGTVLVDDGFFVWHIYEVI